jgi:hypothetical protein
MKIQLNLFYANVIKFHRNALRKRCKFAFACALEFVYAFISAKQQSTELNFICKATNNGCLCEQKIRKYELHWASEPWFGWHFPWRHRLRSQTVTVVSKWDHCRSVMFGLVAYHSAKLGYSLSLPRNICIKVLPARDSLDYPINIHFEEAFAFIESMRAERRNVLIHCHAGVSRSAAVLCAYLMKKNNWTSQRALTYLSDRRSRIKPNDNFLRILKNYENQCICKTQPNQ